MITETQHHNRLDSINHNNRALRLPRVIDKTGLSRTQIYRLIKAGAFPAQIKLSMAISVWDESAIDSWLDAKFRGAK